MKITHYDDATVAKSTSFYLAFIQNFDRRLAVNPNDKTAQAQRSETLRTWREQAQDFFRAGKFDEALYEYSTMATYAPLDKKVTDTISKILRVCHAKAWELTKKGEWEQATKACHTVLTYRQEAGTHAMLGTIFRKQGDFYNAILCYNNALLHQPDHHIAQPYKTKTFVAWKKQADALLSNKKFSEALTEYRTMGSCNPENINTIEAIHSLFSAWHSTAQEYTKRGEWDQAIREYSAILNNSPKDVAALTMLGDFSGKYKDFQKAITYYNTALYYQPNYTLAQECKTEVLVHWKQQAYTSLEQYDIESARRNLHAILDYDKRDTMVLGSLGTIYRKMQDYERAIFYSERAIALDNNNLIAHSNKIHSLAAMGYQQEAQAGYNYVTSVFPAHPLLPTLFQHANGVQQPTAAPTSHVSNTTLCQHMQLKTSSSQQSLVSMRSI